ncbi:hypothetical protein GQ42DRAFT_165960 [Ramicandelaber brevisporus]|nr:hypothetical protein GQ42DRAFT_165960 [Ramicandelaber brevisporus]
MHWSLSLSLSLFLFLSSACLSIQLSYCFCFSFQLLLCVLSSRKLVHTEMQMSTTSVSQSNHEAAPTTSASPIPSDAVLVSPAITLSVRTLSWESLGGSGFASPVASEFSMVSEALDAISINSSQQPSRRGSAYPFTHAPAATSAAGNEMNPVALAKAISAHVDVNRRSSRRRAQLPTGGPSRRQQAGQVPRPRQNKASVAVEEQPAEMSASMYSRQRSRFDAGSESFGTAFAGLASFHAVDFSDQSPSFMSVLRDNNPSEKLHSPDVSGLAALAAAQGDPTKPSDTATSNSGGFGRWLAEIGTSLVDTLLLAGDSDAIPGPHSLAAIADH